MLSRAKGNERYRPPHMPPYAIDEEHYLCNRFDASKTINKCISLLVEYIFRGAMRWWYAVAIIKYFNRVVIVDARHRFGRVDICFGITLHQHRLSNAQTHIIYVLHGTLGRLLLLLTTHKGANAQMHFGVVYASIYAVHYENSLVVVVMQMLDLYVQCQMQCECELQRCDAFTSAFRIFCFIEQNEIL